MRSLVLVVLLMGCRESEAPRPFVLGPGCWTKNVATLTTTDGKHATATVKMHYPACPEALAPGQTLWHWDTTFVAH